MSPRHPLVTVSELAARLGDPRLRIVDCRWYLERPGAGREAYDAGHLPGAMFLDVDGILTAPDGPGRHPLPDPAVFTERLGAMGIGNEHLVVAYDDVGGWVAARLWWMLDDLGHERVAVLDGGIGAWIAADGEITTVVPSWPPARLELADRWTRTIERDPLRARLGRVRLLDARGAPRYRGEVEPVDPVPGHIPTALSAPTDGNLRRRRHVPAAEGPRRPVRVARRRRLGRRRGGDLVRERRGSVPQRPRDAGRRPAVPAPLPWLVQRLEPKRLPGRHRRGAGPAGLTRGRPRGRHPRRRGCRRSSSAMCPSVHSCAGRCGV